MLWAVVICGACLSSVVGLDCCRLESADRNMATPINVALITHPLSNICAPNRKFSLILRGGDAEAQDADSNISSVPEDDDEDVWDYRKFGLKPPPTADELSLNPGDLQGKFAELLKCKTKYAFMQNIRGKGVSLII